MPKRIEKELYTIIIDDTQISHIPLFCDVCDLPMLKPSDDISFREFKCCDHCSTMWAYHDREKWAAGIRPGKEIIDKDKELRARVSNKFIL